MSAQISNERDALLAKPTKDVNYNGENGTEHQGNEANSSLEASCRDEELPKSAWAIVSVVAPMSIGIFMVAVDATVVLSTYAAIGSELKQLQRTSWIATAYMLTVTSFQPLYGKMSDIFGRKTCLLVAYTIFATGTLFCGLARSMNELIAARALAGVGGGGMTTLVTIIMSDVVPIRKRGTWQGVLNILFTTGSFVGAPLGGLLVDTVGWRWVFLPQVPLAILAIGSVSFALKIQRNQGEVSRANFQRIDFGGAFTLVTSVFFLLFALDRGGNVSWSAPVTICSFVAFSVSTTAFAFVEAKIALEPLAPRRIIFDHTLIVSYLNAFFGVAACLTMIFNVSLYFQAVEGKSPSESGLWLLPTLLGPVSGSITGGLVIQATGKYRIAVVVAYLTLEAGLILVALMSGVVGKSMVAVTVGLTVANFGNAMGSNISLIALIANAGREDQAVATAVSYLFRSLGHVFGISVGSAIVQDRLWRALRKRLSQEDSNQIVEKIRESLNYVKELDPETKLIVRGSYESAVHSAFWFTVALAACATVSSLYIREVSLTNQR